MLGYFGIVTQKIDAIIPVTIPLSITKKIRIIPRYHHQLRVWRRASNSTSGSLTSFSGKDKYSLESNDRGDINIRRVHMLNVGIVGCHIW